jgi:hypothetical protein
MFSGVAVKCLLPALLALVCGSACSPLGQRRATIGPYEMDCGPMEENACHTHGSEVIGVAADRYPGRHVIRITITSPDGDYWFLFEDGGWSPVFSS